jgi:DNA-binding response OmpR family regulator
MTGNSTLNAGERADAQTRGRATPSPRILVVDDDIVLRLLGATVLGHSGYQVDTAEDGEAGWEALHARNYDLLITDNNMPKVSGVELVKKLRAEDEALPVILVSGTMPTEELNRNSWLHLAATLEKPFSGEELLEAVTAVLRESASVREDIEPRPVREGRPAAESL